VNKLAANLLCTLLTGVVCAAGIAFAHMLPHYVPFAKWHAVALLVSLVALIPVHEALHALGLLRFARVSRRHIRFGVMWHALMPYCYCSVPISLRAYRRMLLLPLWATGSVTATSLLLYPTDWLGLLAGFAVAACIGDVWMVVKLRRFTDGLRVQDCQSEIGCDVYSEIPETAA
jgi:hypothetical protein